jgi:penicillin-binding protein 1A
MFYGNNSDGIKTAAKTYFNKSVQDLSIEESATLVGLLQRPSNFNPIANNSLSIQRRNMVLYFMKENSVITASQFDSLKSLAILVNRENKRELAPHFNMRLRKELDELGKVLNFDPYVDGLQVFTTLDTAIQIAMDSAINKYIDDIQNQSIRASETQKLYQRYLNNDSTFNSKEEDDSVFRATHVVQYGFIVIKQSTGEVMGHLGGRPNYYYDHVFQGERQPGSLIKPFVYTVAINNGSSPSDKILDTPYISFEEGDTVRWTPDAWDNKAEGLITYRRALKLSKNYAVLHLQDEVGGPKAVRQLMLNLGFTSNILPVLSLPLGTNVVKPIEIVQTYGAFGNNGIWVENHTINKIIDKFGNVIYSANPKKKEVLNENTAFIMTSMMQDVVNSGTGAGIRNKSNVPYHIKVAAKTGTTNDHTDIWTMAYTPVFTVCIWLGLDNPKHKINLWSSVTVPIVGEFIARAYKDHPEWENLDFARPDGVEEVSICGDNDKVQLANVECPIKITEYFRKEFKPSENCSIHSGQKQQKKSNQIF